MTQLLFKYPQVEGLLSDRRENAWVSVAANNFNQHSVAPKRRGRVVL